MPQSEDTLRQVVVVADGADVHPLERLWAGITCTVLRVASYQWAPGWHYGESVADNHVLVVSVRGEAQFSVAGRTVVLRSGGALLMPPHVSHSGRFMPGQSEPTTSFVVHFAARLDGVLDAPELLGLPSGFLPGSRRHGRIVDALGRMMIEVASQRPGAALAANGECAIVLAMLWRETVETNRGTLDSTYGDLSALVRLAPVFDLIRANYAEDISVGRLAELVHLHPVYFSSLFSRTTGLSPTRYLARYRVGRAKQLLASTSMTTDEIARRTGHGTASYLGRVFRRTVGITPGEYRRSRPPGL